MKSLASLLSFALLVACSPSSPDAPESESPIVHANDDDCEVDTDCLAVSRIKCCPNGELASVPRTKVAEYQATKPSCEKTMMCSALVMNDTRVAACRENQCVLVARPPAGTPEPCSVAGMIEKRTCGIVGIQERVCLEEAPLVWGAWGQCLGQRF